MHNGRWVFAGAVILVLLCAASAFAGSVSVQFVNPGNITMGGVYVGPYTISVNGQNTSVICDDAVNEVYSGETWTANTSTIAGGLGGAKWTGITIGAGVDGNASQVTLSQLQEYEAVQYLGQLMINNLSNHTTVGEIQWAIWDLTDPGLINQTTGNEKWGNLSPYLSGIDSYIQQAINNDGGSASYLNIYTPTSIGMCGSNPCTNPTPQEYIQITPEPASLTLLGTGLLALAAGLKKKKVLIR